MSEVIRLDAGGGRKRKGKQAGMNAGEVELGLEGIRALGYDHGAYYYLSPLTQQVVELAAAEHSEANICQLRELVWWVDRYPPAGRVRTKFDVSRARDELMQACHRVGPFDAELARGRGVWWHEGRAVLHDGYWVRYGDGCWRPSDVQLPHIYEAGPGLPLTLGAPLDDDEAGLLLRLAERLCWADTVGDPGRPSISARLLAGWAVVAPVAGALRWRPHLWLTGPKGCGKSWIAKSILRPVLGPICLAVEGDTTAAGLRQSMGRDARAVVWDESEPQGQKGQARVQEALAFARSLSTGDAGQVIKGGQNHKARAFAGVGCFCLVSIFTQLQRESDGSRFTVLELTARRGRTTPEGDREVVRMAGALDRAWAEGLLARTVEHLGALRESHERFAVAVAGRWGDRRLGDQLGALLAGAHLLGCTEPIAAEDAAAQVAELPDALAEPPVALSDEERCLQRLASRWARIESMSGRRPITRTLGDLIRLGLMNAGDDDLSLTEVRRVLERHGITVRHAVQEVAVAVGHDLLAEIYRDSDFAGGWARMLERLAGARRSGNAVRFGAGVQVRATVLPGALFMESSGEQVLP